MNTENYLEKIENDNCERPAKENNFRYDRYDIINAIESTTKQATNDAPKEEKEKQ